MGKGGARAGSGRKPIYDEKMVWWRGIYITEEMLAHVKKQGNISEFIRGLIETDMKGGGK